MRIAAKPSACAAWAVAVAATLWTGMPAAAQDESLGRAPDVPSGPATLEGQVVFPSGEGPAEGIDVLLYALPSGGEPGLRRDQTDAAGRFRFEGISNDPAAVYLVGARYRGVPFPGARVQFREDELLRSVTVRVGELTEHRGELSVPELLVQLAWNGRELEVTESYRVENAGERTAYVAADRRSAATALFANRLPKGVEAVENAFGLPLEGVVQEGDALLFFGPFYPSGWGAPFSPEQGPRLRYTLPAQPGAFTLHRPPLPRVGRVVVSPGPGVSDLEVRGGQPESGETGSVYTVAGSALRDGLVLEFQLRDVRADASALRTREVRVFLELDATALSVREEHLLAVSGDAPLVAAADASLYTIQLPAGIRDLRFDAAALDLGLAMGGEGRLELTGPVPTGESSLSFAYHFPLSHEPARYVTRFDRDLPLLSAFIADTGLRIHTERLHRRRPVRAGTRVYSHWEAFQVAADEPVTIELASLRRASGLPPWGARSVIALLAAAVAWLLLIPLAPAATGRKRRAEAQMPDSARQEREAIYIALRDLEHDYETGKVSEVDYTELRQELRARAAELMRADESRVAPNDECSPPLDQSACPGCGTRARRGDRFCSQCGAALGGALADAAESA